MPLQNRVTPFGEIVAVPERGTMMGNRGILHDARRQIRRPWASKLWICCLLEFRGRREPVMASGHYTRLFFLDEPTALAAGHRPCAFCRPGAYRAFQSAWAAGAARSTPGVLPRAAEMDRVLHDERVGPGGSKRLHPSDLSTLPDGVVVTADVGGSVLGHSAIVRAGDEAWARPIRTSGDGHGLDALLLWGGTLWRWSPGGYQDDGPARPGPVLTLTPPSIVAALSHGYVPEPPVGLSARR
jgi:hypothetical protein